MRESSHFGAGEQNPRSTITEDQVRLFKEHVRQGYSTRAAAREAGITYNQGRNIRFGGQWSHVF